jgi:peptidoglycan/LPS O-acetylase OafA/YrhL
LKNIVKRGSRLFELDALRGIAAVLVLTFHFSMMAGISSPALIAGVTGVDLFFLISGFVIFMTLSEIKSSYEFIVSRLLRLYPTYIVMMGLTILVIYFFNKPEMPGIKVILANLTMMQPLFFTKYIDVSYWTLTVEMQFYILMLVLFMYKGLDKIELIGSIILLLIMIYYIIAYLFFYESKIYILPRSILPLISHFNLFFAGIVFYNMKQKGRNFIRFTILILCLLCSFYLFDKSGRAHFAINIKTYIIMLVLYFTLFYLFVLGKLKFLNIRILLFLGNISYALYLIHQEIGKILFQYLVQGNYLGRIPAIIFIVFLVIFISSVVTYFIEKPVRNLKKYLYRSIVPSTPQYASDGILP